jgi:hypothetical protein
MNTIFNPATRTAELLQARSPSGQLEKLDSALDEGYATSRRIEGKVEIDWHGIFATGWNELEAIANWIAFAMEHKGETA